MAMFSVELVSSDPTRTRALLADGLGLATAGDEYRLGDLGVRIVAAEPGARTGVSRLLMRCEDPAATAQRLAAAGHPARTDPPEVDLHGVRLALAPTGDEAPPSSSPANVVGLDHLGVATDASDLLCRALCDHLGFDQESRQIDTQMTVPVEVFSSDRHGVVSHTGSPRPAGALLVTFLRRGGVDLELLEDIATGGAGHSDGPGSTSGDNRAISRFVARRGAGLHHLAVRVHDIQAGIDRITEHGVRMLDGRGRPGSRAGLIAFADHRSTGGIVVHLVARP